MDFITLAYWLFFALCFAVYYRLRGRAQLGWVVACSVFFYVVYKPVYLLILITQLLIDYAAGWQIGRGTAGRRAWLLASILSNLALLVSFKYIGWLAGLAGYDFRVVDAVPLGLSFHTFQGIAYTVDVYRGLAKPERNFLKFSQYIFFFPQLVAGPIERPGHFFPQVTDKRLLDSNIISGGRLVLWGMVQKMLIADRLGQIADPVFSLQAPYTGAATLMGVLAFSFQILADFSGYTDIARGCARLLGYDLTINFNNPYGATSVSDFWRRWHISLSSWFRDYVYIPLGGSKVGWGHWAFNILITFGLSGIWHGASTTFLVWGLYNGAWIIAERALRLPLAVTRWTTLPAVFAGWVFFRAATMGNAVAVFHRIFSDFHFSDLPGLRDELGASGNLYIALALMAALQACYSLKGRLGGIMEANAWLRWGVYYLAILLLLFLSPIQNPPFIYFQF